MYTYIYIYMISLTCWVGSVGKIFWGIRFLVYVHQSYNYYEIVFCSKGLLVVYIYIYI